MFEREQEVFYTKTLYKNTWTLEKLLWTSVAVYLTVASHSTMSTQHRARCHVNPACIVSRTSK